jgi:hypothetical protein
MFECGNPDEENWMCTGRLSEVHPIELTEEVLLKIGFVKVELVKNKLYKYYKKICIDNYSYILDFRVIPKDEHIGLHIIKDENEDDEVDYYSEVFYSDNIQNLHQLQNAYYLFTNEELEVKL